VNRVRFRIATLTMLLLAGCVSPEMRAKRQQARYAAAKALFDRTVKTCHLPSADAQGAERDRLLQQAAAGYEQLLRDFRDQPAWCAPALRSLGNVRATQGLIDQAIACYRRVGETYAGNDWDVLQSWKSAADLLWEAGRQDEAKAFCARIVARFDNGTARPVEKIIVRAAKAQLQYP